MAFHRCSLSNLTEIERICQEEWKKLLDSGCAKLVETYPRRLEEDCNFCHKCFYKVVNKGSEYTEQNGIGGRSDLREYTTCSLHKNF